MRMQMNEDIFITRKAQHTYHMSFVLGAKNAPTEVTTLSINQIKYMYLKLVNQDKSLDNC